MSRALSWLLPLLAFAVIVFGAYVRLSDAGLGCPDWPGCYGHLTVPEHAPDIHLDDPSWSDRPLESGKAWREMVHRYLASTLGLGIVVLAVLTFRGRGLEPTTPVTYLLVPMVVFQGLLGMWTVTLLLKPLVVSAHLLGGLATLGLLWWQLLVREGVTPVQALPRDLPFLALLALAALVGQIFLGGWTSANYAALACTDFPTCQGAWWPTVDFEEAFVLWRGLGINYEFGVLETPARTAIHVTHRLGAVVAAILVTWAACRALAVPAAAIRRTAWCIIGVLALQLALGITNVVAGLPLPNAVAHNGGAALLLLTVITLVRLTRAPRTTTRP